MIERNKVHQGHFLELVKQVDDGTVDCCITSPPYWGLRDYRLPDVEWPAVEYSPMPELPTIAVDAWSGSLGLEPTIEGFVGNIVSVFREVRRVLKDDGTTFINLGDSYAAGGNGGHESGAYFHGHTRRGGDMTGKRKKAPAGLKAKDLVGIPWRVAFALQADGWYLRSDIIWHKPNPMPESVADRPTKAHEYIFLLSKSARSYYDAEAIKEPSKYPTGPNSPESIKSPYGQGFTRNALGPKGEAAPTESRSGASARMGRGAGFRKKDKQRGHGRRHAGFNDRWDEMSKEEQCSMGRNKRTVWTVATQAFSEAHFAVYPEKLITPCVLAGCPKGGLILDPFDGAGTTRVVAAEYGRDCISFELNPEYIEISNKRYREQTRQTLLDGM